MSQCNINYIVTRVTFTVGAHSRLPGYSFESMALYSNKKKNSTNHSVGRKMYRLLTLISYLLFRFIFTFSYFFFPVGGTHPITQFHRRLRIAMSI